MLLVVLKRKNSVAVARSLLVVVRSWVRVGDD